MTTSGTVKAVTVTASGNIVTIAVTAPPPPPAEAEFLDVPDWALKQFQTALAGNKPTETTHEGGTVVAVKVSA